jgi:hypothetical protein
LREKLNEPFEIFGFLLVKNEEKWTKKMLPFKNNEE